MTIQFNINDQFAFRLTEQGRRMAPAFHPDNSGVYIEQLWRIMEAFGEGMHMTAEQIIEGNLLWMPTELDRINAKIALIQRTGVAS